MQAFTRILHLIPLTVVETRKEVDDIKELIGICKEYHIALRCELSRKELKEGDEQVCTKTEAKMLAAG